MKLIKKITAAVTAMALAASMMSIGASAASNSTWLVRENADAPSFWNIIEETDPLSKNTSINGFYDRCLGFSQNTNHGSMSTVSVRAYVGTFNNPTTVLHLSTYTAVTPSGDNGYKSFPYTISANTVIYVHHYINFNGLPCSMNGDTSL